MPLNSVSSTEDLSCRNFYLLFSLEFLIFLLLSIFYIIESGMVTDDGIYLYAAKRFARGELPYVDFFFSLGPVYYYFYAPVVYLFGTKILTGRILSLLTAFILLLLVGHFSMKLSNRWAFLFSMGFLAVNPECVHGLSMLNLHGLYALFILLAAYFLYRGELEEKFLFISAFISGLAVSARFTSIGASFFCIFYILYKFKLNLKKTALTLISFLLGIILPFFPILLKPNWSNLFYTMIGVVLQRGSNPLFPEGGLLNKIELLDIYLKMLWHIVVLGIAILIFFLKKFKELNIANHRFLKLYLIFFLMYLSVTLIYSLPANATYITYQLDVIPLLSVIVSSLLAKTILLFESKFFRPFLITIILAMIFITPFMQFKKMIMVPILHHLEAGLTPMGKVKVVAEYLKKRLKPGAKVISFEMGLVIEADLEVPRGLGSHPSYVPHWDREKCLKYAVVNDEMLAEMIREKKVDAIILTEADFGVFEKHLVHIHKQTEEDRIKLRNALTINKPFVEKYYNQIAKVQNFGQFDQPLYIYLPK